MENLPYITRINEPFQAESAQRKSRNLMEVSGS
jgi:hypothetical protein